MSGTYFPLHTTLDQDGLKNSLAQNLQPPWKRYDCVDIQYERQNLQSTKGLNFFQALKWSPSGGSIVVLTENQKLTHWPISTTKTDTNEPSLTFDNSGKNAITPSECIYSFTWHPSRNNQKLDSDLIAFSTRDYPIQIYSLSKQQRVSSFYVVDHCERFIGSHCMDFSPDGEYLIAGGTNNFYLFNVHLGQKSPVSTTPTSGHEIPMWEPTLDGVQSSICLNPQDPRTMALGTFNNTVGIYDIHRSRPCQLKFSLANGTGVTHMRWSSDGYGLYVGSRRSTQIEVWDIRYAQDMLYEIKGHNGDTNQRIVFDTLGHEGLVSGGTDGCVSIWKGSQLVEKENVTNQRNITVAAVEKHPFDSSLFALCYGRRCDIMDDEDGFSSIEYWETPFSSLQLLGMENGLA
ncbi:heterotrimeric G protein beta subunit Gnr1 [Schizosaccharomyces cryophilus OY26]|uniref:Heterotrimeric G protein beta subunit Gnr1 n=1 Tax=Schizosaccharomyces cryophilus (strain OY26 / ATCC MYA-4695 / CBS 11777 / NBRC 106824 / NRRL Y48691) TaxID=653667 RepID=S9VQC1_SCHCR|nr:heterotrimeric G protein beta subunit Gnr1 [Schizosaccharomyces cryophilus OY26]EPY50163.1 heterotrimeric G protein beta subunit Gnr1 [Schizosaccharomyces cryophilus OY26]